MHDRTLRFRSSLVKQTRRSFCFRSERKKFSQNLPRREIASISFAPANKILVFDLSERFVISHGKVPAESGKEIF